MAGSAARSRSRFLSKTRFSLVHSIVHLEPLIQLHALDNSMNIALDGCQLEGTFSSPYRDHCRNHRPEPCAVDELECREIEDDVEDLIVEQTLNGLIEDGDVGSSDEGAFQPQNADLASTLFADGHASSSSHYRAPVM
jgi:hypothetical protein